MLTSHFPDRHIDSLLDVITIHSDTFPMPLDPFVVRVLVPDVVEWRNYYLGFNLQLQPGIKASTTQLCFDFRQKLENPLARGPGYRVDARASRIPGGWFPTALTVRWWRIKWSRSIPGSFFRIAWTRSRLRTWNHKMIKFSMKVMKRVLKIIHFFHLFN